MTEKLQQTIKNEIAELPREVQNAIGVVDWVKMAEEIGKKFAFEEDKIEDLQLETLLVLIGVVDPEFYTFNIENHVNTSADLAKQIRVEVSQKIFTPIFSKLEENIKKNMQDKNPNHEQTLDFILSGGDYSAFMDVGNDQITESK